MDTGFSVIASLMIWLCISLFAGSVIATIKSKGGIGDWVHWSVVVTGYIFVVGSIIGGILRFTAWLQGWSV
jgi:hypothetical protein